jgi:hypothetical protein
MNLAQLRKLVAETQHLPEETAVVTSGAEHGTYEKISSVYPMEVLAFKRPRSQCPLGSTYHYPDSPEVFGFASVEELEKHAQYEMVLRVC